MLRSQVGRFEIRRELGRGYFGDVALAWDPAYSREVALKIIPTAQGEQEQLEKIEAERNGSALQARLAEVAPQIAAIYDQGEDDGYFWVAMEYVEGEDLAQILKRGALAEPRAVNIAIQLLAMLEACQG